MERNTYFCSLVNGDILLIGRQVESNSFTWSLLVSNTESESEMLNEIRPSCGS